MDFDEYDDDIADEDLIVAASQAPNHTLATAGHNGSNRRSHVKQSTLSGNSFNSRRVGPTVNTFH